MSGRFFKNVIKTFIIYVFIIDGMPEFKHICSTCTKPCCEESYVQLTADEAKRYRKHAVKSKGIWLLKSMHKPCIFHKSTGCKLEYNRRPLSCKLYPITFSQKGRRYIAHIDKGCMLHQRFNIKDYKELIAIARTHNIDRDIAISETQYF